MKAIVLSLALAVAGSLYAQDAPPATSAAPPPSAPPQRSAADLEKLLAPIALYSDPLIATVLPASVYPLEIVQAARFVQNTNNLAKLDDQPWDENVKAVARVPAAIQKMNDDLSWTVELGETFLAQEKDVMDTIQTLRAKAQKAGTLQTTPQQVVVVTNTVIEKIVQQQVVFVTNTIVQIQPANPQVIYVPTYNPYTVYYPPPAYVYNPYAPLVTFGVGVAVGAIIANNCDWHGGGVYVGSHGVAVWGSGGYHGINNVNVNVNNYNNVNVNKNYNANINNQNNISGNRPQPNTTGGQQKWQPDQSRLNKSGANPSTTTAQARGWSSGATSPTATGSTARPSPSSPGGAARPATTSTWQGNSPSAARPSPAASNNRSTPSPSASRSAPGTSRQSAYSGMSSGASTWQASNRGSTSRGGGGFSRGGGGGGRR